MDIVVKKISNGCQNCVVAHVGSRLLEWTRGHRPATSRLSANRLSSTRHQTHFPSTPLLQAPAGEGQGYLALRIHLLVKISQDQSRSNGCRAGMIAGAHAAYPDMHGGDTVLGRDGKSLTKLLHNLQSCFLFSALAGSIL